MAYFKCKGAIKAQPVTSFSVASWSTGKACAYWVAPTRGKFNGVKVMYKTESAPTSPTDGTLFYEGAGSDLALTNITTVHGATKDGFVAGTTYYFSCFSYYESNGNRKYNPSGYETAQWTAQSFSGSIECTYTQDWTVPTGVRSVTVFVVGGGGNSGSWAGYNGNYRSSGGGGGAGCTTAVNVAVTPGEVYRATIAGATGTSSFIGKSASGGGSSESVSAFNGSTAGGSPGSGGGWGGTGGMNSQGTSFYGSSGGAGTSFNGVNFAAGGSGGYNSSTSNRVNDSAGNGEYRSGGYGTGGTSNRGGGAGGAGCSTYTGGGGGNPGGSGYAYASWS